MEYSFTLKYQVDQDITDALLDDLFEAGCSDATVGVGVAGRVALMFAREAVSAESAMLGVMEDVRRALPAAKLIEVGPDLA